MPVPYMKWGNAAHCEGKAGTMNEDEKEKNVNGESLFMARLKSAYESFEKRFGGELPAWLRPVRAEAFSRFSEAGFPTTRDELWRFTSLASLEETVFEPAFSLPQPTVSRSDIDRLIRVNTGGTELVFINGVWSKDLSRGAEPSSSIAITSLQEEFCRDGLRAEGLFRSIETGKPDAFTALNTAFVSEGICIEVKEGASIPSPVHLVFLSTGTNGPVFTQPRTLIRLGKNSKLTVIEDYLTLAEGSAYWTNTVTDLCLDEGAKLAYVRWQRESESAFHISTVNAELKRASSFASTQIDFGGRLVRNNLNVRLKEPEAACELNGLYLTHAAQHVDNCTLIHHPEPRGTSRQLYKGIVDGESRAVFSGKILVAHGAQKTDARQTNKNLLLSPQAVVDTKPHLEIFSGDVKCAHGAAVGRLNPDGIFYLQSRGLSGAKAREILAYGFANEVIQRIPIPEVRGELERALLKRLSSRPKETVR